MLVSYDIFNFIKICAELLQGHQNVGELRLLIETYQCPVVTLQGHQNVGELRLTLGFPTVRVNYCRVTRMLVSYDLGDHAPKTCPSLQGHQNVGELRPFAS